MAQAGVFCQYFSGNQVVQFPSFAQSRIVIGRNDISHGQVGLVQCRQLQALLDDPCRMVQPVGLVKAVILRQDVLFHISD